MEPSPTAILASSDTPSPPDTDPDYWYSLIDEKAAAEFLNLTDRTMQKLRQRGGGPRYSELSVRCIRYTRFGLRQWAESRIRTSTSDTGELPAEEAAP